MLRDEARSRGTTYIFGHLVTTIEHGQPLSAGLREFEREFGAFSINIIRIGEASGTLHENLEYLAEEMRRKQALKRKIIGTLIYPALVVLVTVGIAILLTVYIFPKILPIFSTIQATLPLSTRILIALSLFLSSWWEWLLLGLLAAIIGFVALMRIPRCHYVADRILLSLPLFGTLSSYYNLANINRTLSILLKSAVPILDSIELAAASTRNLVYKAVLFEAREKIMHGQKISAHLKDNPAFFPTIITQMVSVGESTGNLSPTLEFLSTLYEQEIDEYTKHLTNLLEPILMIIMGLIVGFIAISIITPIYGITEHLSDTR
jgi:type II secretory pathway component PulF